MQNDQERTEEELIKEFERREELQYVELGNLFYKQNPKELTRERKRYKEITKKIGDEGSKKAREMMKNRVRKESRGDNSYELNECVQKIEKEMKDLMAKEESLIKRFNESLGESYATNLEELQEEIENFKKEREMEDLERGEEFYKRNPNKLAEERKRYKEIVKGVGEEDSKKAREKMLERTKRESRGGKE